VKICQTVVQYKPEKLNETLKKHKADANHKQYYAVLHSLAAKYSKGNHFCHIYKFIGITKALLAFLLIEERVRTTLQNFLDL